MVWMLSALAACHGGLPCKDAVMKAAARFGNADVPEVPTLIGTCEQEAWSGGLRECFANAETASALEDCFPALDVTIPAWTITPSAATRALLAPNQEPIKALRFFDDAKGQPAKSVAAYFAALGVASEAHDRFVEATAAERYKVRENSVVLVRGDKSQTIPLGYDEDRQLAQLRTFDSEVAVQLAKLMRPPRIAYLVAGHGEMTDPSSLPPALVAALPQRKVTHLTKELGELGYEIKPLTLATDVPADATVVLLLAPAVALQPAESAALDRYLDRGGSLLVTLDPTVEPGLGPLEAKLGVHYNRGHLTDDKVFLPQHGNPSDHRFVLVSSFSAHASTTSLSRASSKGMVLIDSGTLEPVAAAGTAPKLTFTIRTQESSFIDLNDNFTFDAATEKRGRYNIAAAVEGPAYRVLVFADTDLFIDVAVQSAGKVAMVMISGPLFSDSIRWLGRAEVFAGDVVTPEPQADTKERIAALLELGQRKLARSYARLIAAPASERSLATGRLETDQKELVKLRALADKK